MSIIMVWHVLHNKTDLNIWNKEECTGLIVDAAVPIDINCLRKYAEKLTIYRDLELEIQSCGNMQKIKTITITVGYFGTFCEILQENI